MAPLKTFVFVCCLLFIGVLSEETKTEEKTEAGKDDATESADASEVREEEDVIVLNQENFDAQVAKHKTLLVEFYAPWCGHCKTLAPEYAAAAKELKKNDPPVALGKVDATVHSELAQRFQVQGYPTLRFFKDGKDYDYDGQRHQIGIIEFMKNIAKPDWKPEPEAVVTLTSADFDMTVQKEEIMMVEFYAPWCGHCKSLAPIYEKAAKQMKKWEPPVILAKVDATQEADLAKKYEVSGYPTLKIFKKGKVIDFDGERNNEYDLINAITTYMGDGAKTIDNLKMLKAVLPVDDIAVVGFFEKKDDPGYQAYMDLADELRKENYKFAVCYDEAARKNYNVQPGSVVVFMPERFWTIHEPTLYIMQLTATTKMLEVRKFVESHLLPMVGEYKDDMISRYMTRRPLVLFFYTVDFGFDHRKATQMWRKKIAAVANKNKDYTFAIANEESQAKLLSDFGLDESGEDMNVALFGNDGKKYGMEPMDSWDADDVQEFLNKFKKGKLTPHIKSQRPPKKQGPVVTVVGKTFEAIVNDPNKDVLIEMYAPWCGHCKSLEPKYLSLAKKLKKEKNLTVAKIDATANDIPDTYKVEGFPTIYFAPSNKKDAPILFGGARDVDDFVKFLKENAVASFKSSDKDEL